MSHPNVDVMRMSDEAMQAGDVQKFLSYFTDDLVMHAGGQNSLAGTYKGQGGVPRTVWPLHGARR